MIFLKKQNFEICYGLRSYEFECRCEYEHCTSSFINEDLVKAYEKLRSTLARPLTITSGHRCSNHNFDVGGSKKSQHMEGKAIDIDTRFLNQEVIEKLAIDSGFTKVIKYKTFIHLDVR